MAQIGKFTPDNLIAGDFPEKAVSITAKLATDLKRGDVVSVVSGICKKIGDGEEVRGIITDNVTKIDDDTELTFAVYIKGEFLGSELSFGTTDTETIIDKMNLYGLIVRR